MIVRINDLSGNEPKRYLARSVEDCADPTDRVAYKECVASGDTVTVGFVIAVPFTGYKCKIYLHDGPELSVEDIYIAELRENMAISASGAIWFRGVKYDSVNGDMSADGTLIVVLVRN